MKIMILSLIGAAAVSPLLVLPIMAKLKARAYRRFFKALWVDLKAKAGDDAIMPTTLQEALNTFYPALPKYDKCFEFSPNELADRVSWTIDPKEHGLRIPSSKLHRSKNG